MKKLIVIMFILLGGSVGYNSFETFFNFLTDGTFGASIISNSWFGMVIGALIGSLIGILVVDPILNTLKRLTQLVTDLSTSYLICGSLGLIFGLIISWLINFSLQLFNIPYLNEVVSIVVTFTLAYVGFYFGASQHEEVAELVKSLVIRRKDADEEDYSADFIKYKVLDTSTIIDGRIIEVIRSGFLEGIFIVSSHVLKELQYIADSSDSLKRTHGRRGLDILNELQEDEKIKIEMNDRDFEGVEDVDLKLVHLAKEIHGAVITNDYNLNKVAQFQKVPVLNINELASLVKPVVIPGEQLRVTVVKKGTERNQGVAYLDNGTMVVVEEGKDHINESLNVIVTSSLQTNAGRMIFADIADEPNYGNAEFVAD